MIKIENIKKDILKDFINQKKQINRENLLSCLLQNQVSCDKGYITLQKRNILDSAVIEIWNDTFNTSLNIKDIIRS